MVMEDLFDLAEEGFPLPPLARGTLRATDAAG